MRVVFSTPALLRLIVAGAITGFLLIVSGAILYLLGFGDGTSRTQSNLVPFSFFSGIVLILVSGAGAICHAPERLKAPPAWLGIALLSVASLAAIAVYARQEGKVILVPVDLVMGSESQFVDHIIRLRAGQPQYTPGDDANTSAYTPGAPILTYAIARAAGYPSSIAAYRLIQQLYLIVAAIFAAGAARSLLRFCMPASRLVGVWLLFWVPFFYLAANNPITNVYTHVLYSDGLALTMNAIAFWLLIKHLTSEDDRWLIPMALLPGISFFVKQKEAIWAALFVLYLLLAGKTSVRKVVIFAAAAFGSVGLAVAVCYLLWGDPFLFWSFTVLGALHVGLTTMFKQVADSGYFVMMGIIGGFLLFRGAHFRRLFPAWVCWIVLLLAAIYTSGVAYRPAHLGPASLIAAVWFAVALATLWPEKQASPQEPAHQLWKMAAITGGIVLLILSTGMLRFNRHRPDAGASQTIVPSGLKRYTAEIEAEFQGLPAERVLLDSGSWVYLRANVVMKDRESPIGTLWGTEESDFAGTIERIRSKAYIKILARKLPKGDFLLRGEAIQKALRENYREVRVIRATEIPPEWLYPPLLYDVAVLVPNSM